MTGGLPGGPVPGGSVPGGSVPGGSVPGRTVGRTVLPGFLDAHVHLALIDPAPLTAGGIARVLDLGGWRPPRSTLPVESDPWARPGRVEVGTGEPQRAGRPASALLPETVFAGQFLAAPGGYPSERSWAPAGSVRFVAQATDAAAAVDDQLALGASVIKVTLNGDAGPVLPRAVLAAIVGHAHDRGAPVLAHAEGAGQALRAFEAGVDALAHTPFSERLGDEVIAAMAGRMAWISTLDIHGWGEPTDDFDRAVDNLRRFHRAGGQVLYGTDLGNGPLPVGLNRREITALLGAGLSGADVLRSLTMGNLGGFRTVLRGPTGTERLVTVLCGERPADPAAFSAWLGTARAISPADLGDLGDLDPRNS
ncbi:amidohydrolase [Cryobacterium sp. TMT2-18-3]|uniref:amidohydrolase family protein n=1 Tax=unclassified Cryobacterium TaxID=2649013 RepID=UPI00106B3CD3|nr:MULTISPECIES: amidohydrolase [unclassified Cryobacterium]TFC25254.1 amidohydrolase [Cryobacterium sp. TMT2-18-2]TFC62179.1 amidohydrolase [Cryobacterium sp. TMT2-18-3]